MLDLVISPFTHASSPLHVTMNVTLAQPAYCCKDLTGPGRVSMDGFGGKQRNKGKEAGPATPLHKSLITR